MGPRAQSDRKSSKRLEGGDRDSILGAGFDPVLVDDEPGGRGHEVRPGWLRRPEVLFTGGGPRYQGAMARVIRSIKPRGRACRNSHEAAQPDGTADPSGSLPKGVYPPCGWTGTARGLLVLTDDGRLAGAISAPRAGPKRQSGAGSRAAPEEADLAKLRRAWC